MASNPELASDCSCAVPTAPSVGCPVIGVIDGKFDTGYLVTVTIGKEKLKGVLYQTSSTNSNQVQQTCSVAIRTTDSTPTTSGALHRRRRRSKSELRKRDPSHPKPNRSGYTFFFSEQHPRLKPLHPGKDREISRMIGELWNSLKDNEKAVRIGFEFNFMMLLLMTKKHVKFARTYHLHNFISGI